MLEGYAAAVRGDRQAAIRSMEDALGWGPPPDPPLLGFVLGKLWIEEGDFARAERYLKPLEMREVRPVNALTEFYLGQVYEGLGDEREARLHYARFVSWWEDCDPELRPIWEQGRAALQRLTEVPKL